MNNRTHLSSDALTSQAHRQGLSSQAGLCYLPGCSSTSVLPCALKLSPLDKMDITQVLDAALKISEDFDGDEEDVATDVSPFFLLLRPSTK